MTPQPPVLDPRDAAALRRELDELRPFYVPEWSSRDPGDPGAALAEVFVSLLEGLVRRLDEVPQKSLTAFLDRIGTRLQGALPARVPLAFTLSRGATATVTVPARSQAAGDPGDGGDPVVFETEKSFVATPAALAAVFHAVPERDEVVDHLPALEAGTLEAGAAVVLFDAEGGDLQEHALYVGHGELFEVSGPVRIELDLEPLDERLAAIATTGWQYHVGEGTWRDFDRVTLDPSQPGRLALVKEGDESLETVEVGGVESRFLRWTIAPGAVDRLVGVELRGVAVSVRPLDAGTLRPETALHNDVELDVATPFLPFGSRPRLFDTFYLASAEAFSKRGALVTLSFTSGSPPASTAPSADLALAWEYWDGTGWRAIAGLEDGTANLEQGGDVTFTCPGDLARTEVLGQESFWIRVRITSGDYGREDFRFEGGELIRQLNFAPPEFVALAIDYAPTPSLPEALLTLNNLDLLEVTGAETFPPFVALEGPAQALYLGLDRPLEPGKGPFSLFFDFAPRQDAVNTRPRLVWEYLRREPTGEDVWARLEVLDPTRGLTESGAVELFGPARAALASRFGRRGYWLRVLDVDGRFEAGSRTAAEPPRLAALLSNTTWAVQAETRAGEILGSGTATANQGFQLSATPVIEEEIRIDELGALSEAQAASLDEIDAVEERDASGTLTALRVLWRPIDDLRDAGAEDRVYQVDRVSGEVRFGDGVHGRVPPIGRDIVRATYRAGGGARGNVAAGAVGSLRSTIPLVDGVSNPLAAAGGADTELLERALERGPQKLRHRDRAVTRSDYEALAREASQAVARARCLPLTNAEGARENGWVTVVVVPESPAPRPFPSRELLRRVETHLGARAPGVTVLPTQVRVIGPAYFEVAVTAGLVAVAADLAPAVELEARRRLEAFLHPLTGGADARGWPFGRLPCRSDVFSLLEAVPDLDHVENLVLTLRPVTPEGLPNGEAVVVDAATPAELALPEHTLVASGEHQLDNLLPGAS